MQIAVFKTITREKISLIPGTEISMKKKTEDEIATVIFHLLDFILAIGILWIIYH